MPNAKWAYYVSRLVIETGESPCANEGQVLTFGGFCFTTFRESFKLLFTSQTEYSMVRLLSKFVLFFLILCDKKQQQL